MKFMFSRTIQVFGVLAGAWLLGACAAAPRSTPTPAATATPLATSTPLATIAPTVTPTLTPAPISVPTVPIPGGPPRVIGYFTSWGVAGRGYTVARIPADQVTHINYAFSAITYFGKCALGDPNADTKRFYSARDSVDKKADVKDGPHGTFNQFLQLKQKYPHLKVLISIGGWNGSDQFSDIALTEASRQVFVQSCVDLYFQQYPGVFDGIDIDWEYPVSGGSKEGRPEDKHNFTLLLAEFRKQLNAQGLADGKQYLLTIAAPAGPQVYANLELDQIHLYLDWINVMTYDFHGTWDAVTNFNSPLYKSSTDPSADPVVRETFNTDAALQAYLKAGIPSQKLVMGIPFYGRGWQGVADQNHGLYQTATGAAPGTWEPGVFDYTDIKRNYLPTYTRYWQDEAKVPWIYNPTKGVMITYEDPESVGLKAGYVKEHALGGVMIWELSNDGGELLNAIYNSLRP